jgi:hypothetical protein
MRRLRRAAILGLPLLWPALGAGQPAVADAVWHGRLTCDPLPGVTQRPLNQPLTVTVSGGVARYERLVLTADGQQTGYAERGEGPVARDGAVTLTGLATGRGFRYTARYSGRLGADGRGALAGEQEWIADRGIGMQTRPCRIGLRRDGNP